MGRYHVAVDNPSHRLRLGVAPPDDGVAGALLACHERIRRFAALAVRLAHSDAPPAERAEAAAAVIRYFTLALPLHAEDEDRSLAPRLRGRDAALDAALDRIADEHVTHVAPLAAVVDACRAIVAAPDAPTPPSLAADAAALASAFEAHLRHEEATLVPAAATLAAADAAEIHAEMRARRAP